MDKAIFECGGENTELDPMTDWMIYDPVTGMMGVVRSKPDQRPPWIDLKPQNSCAVNLIGGSWDGCIEPGLDHLAFQKRMQRAVSECGFHLGDSAYDLIPDKRYIQCRFVRSRCSQ